MLSNIQATIKNATYSPEAIEAEKQEIKEQEKFYSTFKQELVDLKDKFVVEQGKGNNSQYDMKDIDYILLQTNENITWLKENRKTRLSKLQDKYSSLFESTFLTNLEERKKFLSVIKYFKSLAEQFIKRKKKDEVLSPFEKEYLDLVEKETANAYKWAEKNRLTADKGDYKQQTQNLSDLLERTGQDKLKEKVNKEIAEKNKFDGGRLAKKVFSIFGIVLLVGLIIGFGLLGTSLAMNLNAYRSFYYRVFYMIYGFIFSFFVISYVFIYLKFWLGKRIPYFSLIPLFEGCFNSEFLREYFSWLTFNPNFEDLDYLANHFYDS
jgi:hypothetical protein